MPLCAGVAALVAYVRPRIASGSHRLLDILLALCLIVVAAQLVPLPPAIRTALSPHAAGTVEAVTLARPASRPAPISIDPASTAWALALGAAYVALFWCARTLFATGGIRQTSRNIAVLGLALTVLVAVQRTTSPKLLYWRWQPLSTGASPYGPFINRNSLAGWLAMAVPLAIGYAIARRRMQPHGGRGLAGVAADADATTVLVAGSACLMLVGLFGSLSRSGVFGAALALTAFVAMTRPRSGVGRTTAGVAGGIAVMIAVAAAYGNLGALAMRMQETTELGEWGRRVIWRDTLTMIRDFAVAGVGAGAFQRGMLVYQHASREFFFNHAHNEYLQIVAEGGIALAVPAACALAVAVAEMLSRLRADQTAMFWVRAGAIAGILAIAVQSLFDTTLRTPANGVLFAVIAAIALHERDPHRSTRR